MTPVIFSPLIYVRYYDYGLKCGDGQDVEYASEDKKCVQNISQKILCEKTAWSKKAVVEPQNVPYKTQHQDQTCIHTETRKLPLRCNGNFQQFLSTELNFHIVHSVRCE